MSVFWIRVFCFFGQKLGFTADAYINPSLLLSPAFGLMYNFISLVTIMADFSALLTGRITPGGPCGLFLIHDGSGPSG